jgi:glycosyltransferase involved in cell wall biosynthesis
MTITYDLRYASDHFPGVGTYAYWLLRSLLAKPDGERFQVLWDPTTRTTRFDLDPIRSDPRVTWVERPLPALGVASSFGVGRLLRRLRPDVYFSPFYLRPVAPGCPCVLVLHDVQPLRSGGSGGPVGRMLFRLALRQTVRADRVVTDSEFSRSEILAVTGLAPGRVTVVRPGVPRDSAFPTMRRPASLPDGSFALAVGINKPHKNLQTLAVAWESLGRDAPLRLVHAGPKDPRHPALAGAPGGAPVLALGRVDEEELAWLYRHATLLLFPSLYEGFGFPLLEAMASGLPALVADIAPLRELGGEAAMYLPPQDPAAWAAAVKALTADEGERTRLAMAGRARAADFQYSRTAAEVLGVLREARRKARP